MSGKISGECRSVATISNGQRDGGRATDEARGSRAQHEYLHHQRADATAKNDEKCGGAAPAEMEWLSRLASGHAARGD